MFPAWPIWSIALLGVLGLTWHLALWPLLRRRLDRCRARRLAEHERLTSWTRELAGDGQDTVPLYRTSAGLVVMTPEAVRAVAEGRLTSRRKRG